MKMPFGKYKGDEVADIPESYLTWLLDDCELKTTLRRAVEMALGLHHFKPRERERKQTKGGLTTEVVGQWYRQLAREFHPDHGGTHAGMVAINRGHEVLLELTGI